MISGVGIVVGGLRWPSWMMEQQQGGAKSVNLHADTALTVPS
jgi:hypothetical protein